LPLSQHRPDLLQLLPDQSADLLADGLHPLFLLVRAPTGSTGGSPLSALVMVSLGWVPV
jgi:hypothetical protein